MIDCTRLFAADPLPSPGDIDFLVIMGGPMSVHGERESPWLKLEKRFVDEALKQSIPILGVCLGAQRRQ